MAGLSVTKMDPPYSRNCTCRLQLQGTDSPPLIPWLAGLNGGSCAGSFGARATDAVRRVIRSNPVPLGTTAWPAFSAITT